MALTPREKRFFKLFDEQAESSELLKKYILSKRPLLEDKKLKTLLNGARKANETLLNFLKGISE